MITITLENKVVTEILEIVAKLRSQGLIQNVDFDFSYVPARYDDEGYWIQTVTHFKFYREDYATLFTLKYSG